MRGTLFWGPFNKDPTILGYYIRVPLFSETPKYSDPSYDPPIVSQSLLAYSGLHQISAGEGLQKTPGCCNHQPVNFCSPEP